MMAAIFCLLVALVPCVLCLREMQVESSFDLNLIHDSRSAAAACQDTTILVDTCARLKMTAGVTSTVPDISLQEVGDYFMVSTAELDGFATAMGLGGPSSISTFGCDTLCEKTVGYLQNDRGWLIPPEVGQVCTHWHQHSCVTSEPVSFKSMGKLAEAMDVSGANTVDDREPVHEKKKWLSKNPDANNGMPELHYSALQLALAVANLFQVFPSPPISSTSLLEGNPPDFGDEIVGADRSHWQEIVPLSEAWIGSALSEVPRNLHLVKVFMGRDDNATIGNIRKILLGMQRTLGEVMIRSGETRVCQAAAEMLAYVQQYTEADGTFRHGEQVGARYVIRVCPLFMGEDFIEDPTYRYGTLVHEASHHWGTKDEAFEGGSPYGLMQTLLMAKTDPLKASRNADNFMWLVYFLNLCSSRENVEVPKSDNDGPCSLWLKNEAPASNDHIKVKVRIQCKTQARGVTLNFMSKDRVYLAGEKKFGTLQADNVAINEWTSLGSFSLPIGTKVHVFYEAGCNIWEALDIVAESPPRRTPLASPVTRAKMLHSLADADREPNRVPESGIWLPASIALTEVDVTIHFGMIAEFLTFAQEEYKCCKDYDGKRPTQLIDVTSIEKSKRDCGTIAGSGWHSHDNRLYAFINKQVYDGTCKISFEDFKRTTQATRAVADAAAPLPSIMTAVVTGVPVRIGITDETCNTSVSGAKRRGQHGAHMMLSPTPSHFFSERACECDEGYYVAGTAIRCAASVEKLRFFNPVALSGAGCECRTVAPVT